MSRICTICHHPRLREITSELMVQQPLRDIEARYDLSRSALDRHIKRHVTAALRKLTAADMPIAQATEIGEAVLVETRRLNAPTSASAALLEANVCPR
jgi:hypothetical protein